MKIISTNKISRGDHLILLAEKDTDWSKIEQPEENIDIIKSQVKKEVKQIVIPSPTRMIFVVVLDPKNEKYKRDDEIRKAGNKILSVISKHKLDAVSLKNFSSVVDASLSFAEGMAMGSYQFLPYKKEEAKEATTLK